MERRLHCLGAATSMKSQRVFSFPTCRGRPQGLSMRRPAREERPAAGEPGLTGEVLTGDAKPYRRVKIALLLLACLRGERDSRCSPSPRRRRTWRGPGHSVALLCDIGAEGPDWPRTASRTR